MLGISLVVLRSIAMLNPRFKVEDSARFHSAAEVIKFAEGIYGKYLNMVRGHENTAVYAAIPPLSKDELEKIFSLFQLPELLSEAYYLNPDLLLRAAVIANSAKAKG